MMRVVIMGAVAFLVSLGGTTGALVMKAKKAAAIVADSAEARPDSAAAHTDSAKAKGDSAGTRPSTGAAHADSAAPLPDPRIHVARDSATHGATTDSTGTATSSLGAKPTGGEVPLSFETNGPKSAAYKQLARIFQNMKATDAAKVLALMSDEEVQGVLQQLGVRPAAGLLAALPKERAAVLSRRMLAAGGKKDSTP